MILPRPTAKAGDSACIAPCIDLPIPQPAELNADASNQQEIAA
jgi:hypothetical protein